MKIVVYGTPAPQGSKKFLGTFQGRDGRTHARMGESSKKVPVWREAVKTAALTVRNGAPALDGPLLGSIIFTVARPKKPRFQHPATMPDLSKLLRCTEDALTDAGAIADDARIVRYRDLAKVFVGDPEALDAPGCVIVIEQMTLVLPASNTKRKQPAKSQPQLFPISTPEPF